MEEVNNNNFEKVIDNITQETIEDLNKLGQGKIKVFHDRNLISISDKTGHFYCRPEHAERIIREIVEEWKEGDDGCSSVPSNGSVNGLYIYNPEIGSYKWDDNGVIKNQEDL